MKFKKMETKTVRETRETLARQTTPLDANPAGNVHGGAIMKFIDEAAGIVAMRHSGCKNVVTARIDNIEFRSPVFIGNVIKVEAFLNYTGRTSMEIGISAEAEEPASRRVTHISSPYVVMVAINKKGKPIPVPSVNPETPEEKERYEEGRKRAIKRRWEHANDALKKK